MVCCTPRCHRKRWEGRATPWSVSTRPPATSREPSLPAAIPTNGAIDGRNPALCRPGWRWRCGPNQSGQRIRCESVSREQRFAVQQPENLSCRGPGNAQLSSGGQHSDYRLPGDDLRLRSGAREHVPFPQLQRRSAQLWLLRIDPYMDGSPGVVSMTVGATGITGGSTLDASAGENLISLQYDNGQANLSLQRTGTERLNGRGGRNLLQHTNGCGEWAHRVRLDAGARLHGRLVLYRQRL